MADFVTNSECQRTREGMYKDLTRVGCQLDKCDGEVTDTKIILAKLTILQEIALKNQDDLSTTVRDIDKRVLDRDTARAEMEARAPKFWESDTGEWVIKAGVTIAIVIVLAALGQSIWPVVEKWIGGK